VAKKGRKRKRKYVKKLNFKSKEAYRKWLAYNYIHNPDKMQKKPHKEIYIKGKKKRVKHGK